MKINVEGAKSGWRQYVIEGTKEKPRNKNLIEVIDGDIELGDQLCKNNKYEESYYRIVLAFKGKPNDEIMLSAYEDFKKEFFIGLNEDEYHIDAVVHKDTDNYHIHVRVPKQNLLTNTSLQLYMHSIDMPRKEAIQNYLDLKYNLETEKKEKPLIYVNKKIEYIKKWRQQHNIKAFDFSKRKEKQQQEAQIYEYLKSGYESNAINSLSDVKQELKKLNLNIVNEGFDRTKQFHYLTVEDQGGKKLRLKGEIFNAETYTKQDTKIEIKDTREVQLLQAKRRLRIENEKRYKKCKELFDKQRERVRQEQLQLQEQFKHIEREVKTNDSTRTTTRKREEEKQTATTSYQATRTRLFETVENKRESLFERARNDFKEVSTAHQREQQHKRNFIEKISEFGRKITEFGKALIKKNWEKLVKESEEKAITISKEELRKDSQNVKAYFKEKARKQGLSM
jgi:hypothetical protein